MENDAKSIFQAALDRVNPARMISDCLSIDKDLLRITTETSNQTVNLTPFREIIVIGYGKASAKMASGLEDVLGDRIGGGLVVVKDGHTEPLKWIQLREASHPVPDERGLKAAEEIANICRKAQKDTLIINLVSGGGSALLTLPYRNSNHQLSLGDLQSVTGLLLGCGAPIKEINTIRKHLSALKGGRLAEISAPAALLTLILSDVVGDPLNSIASGPTVGDPATYKDADSILRTYGIIDKVPASVLRLINDGIKGNIEDTPKENSPAFANTMNILIGSNYSALLAAQQKARNIGYETSILTTQLTGEAREIAKIFSGIARDAALGRLGSGNLKCIIAGGETTVTLKGDGKGGRNQEMVLSFLSEFMEDPELLENVVFLSGGTDGNDGPTDAAGGIASHRVVKKALEKGLDPSFYINKSDSYNYLQNCGGLLVTGPTNTNVCDVQILLTGKHV